MRSRYVLEVMYPAPNGKNINRQIEGTVGKESYASGCGMGERDLAFDFRSASQCSQAAARVIRNAMYPGLRIHVYRTTEEPDDDQSQAVAVQLVPTATTLPPRRRVDGRARNRRPAGLDGRTTAESRRS